MLITAVTVVNFLVKVRKLNVYHHHPSLLAATMNVSSPASNAASSHVGSNNLTLVDYEVYGKVQGVFFRKYTKAKGSNLGLRGWVQNTSRGTVVGQLEGNKDKIVEMKKWLQSEGSPKSRVEKVEFRNEQPVEKHTFNDFTIRK